VRTYKAALIKEQEVKFVVINISDFVIDNVAECNSIITTASTDFSNPLIFLAGKNLFGQFVYRGVRDDILNFLSRFNYDDFQWKRIVFDND